MRRDPVEPRPTRRDRLVVLGLDVAVARVERLDLETARPARPATAARRASRKRTCGPVLVGCVHGSSVNIRPCLLRCHKNASRSRNSWIVIVRGSSSGMIEVVCGLRSAISSGLDRIQPALRVGEDERPVGRLLEQDAGEDGPVGPGHAPGDELRGDFLARRDDRFDQPAAVDAGGQGR